MSRPMRNARPGTALLIEDFIIREVDLYSALNLIETYTVDHMADVLSSVVKKRVIPVNRICQVGRKDLFIAYSKQVEDLLAMPIRAIVNKSQEVEAQLRSTHLDLNACRSRLNKLRSSFWLRLKFLFTN